MSDTNEQEIQEAIKNALASINNQKSKIDMDEILSFFGESHISEQNNEINVQIDNIEAFRRMVSANQLEGVTGITIKLENFEELTDEDIETILSMQASIKLNTNNLRGCSPEILEKLADSISYTIRNDILSGDNPYSKEDMTRIIEVITSMKEVLGDSKTDLDRFMTIYKTLMMSIDYDFSGCQGKEECTDEGVKTARSLKGALLEGRAVCHGFSLALKQVLEYYGMEAKFIVGLTPSGGAHAWNQVKIDGNWYNTDLTWDYRDARRESKYDLEYCLVGDEAFYESHTPQELGSDYWEECETDYLREKISEHSATLQQEIINNEGRLGKGVVNLGQYEQIAYLASVEPEFMTELCLTVRGPNDRGIKSNGARDL